jgi:SAM-dependent methyltransferase
MAKDGYDLGAEAARIYEEQKVRAIFAPLAEATLDALEPTADEALLDIACGIGVVARTARRRLGARARIAGADLNEHMIAVAREVCGQDCDIDFRVAPVEAMPFEDGAFTLAICQQGLQFFPDEDAALAEARRLLAPGGRLAITIWAGPSPLFSGLAEAIARHVDDAVAEKSLAPFSYSDHAALPGRLVVAGFAAAAARDVTVSRRIVAPETAIRKEIMGNPIGPDVAAGGDEVIEAVVRDTLAAVAAYRVGDELIVPQTAILYIAEG